MVHGYALTALCFDTLRARRRALRLDGARWSGRHGDYEGAAEAAFTRAPIPVGALVKGGWAANDCRAGLRRYSATPPPPPALLFPRQTKKTRKAPALQRTFSGGGNRRHSAFCEGRSSQNPDPKRSSRRSLALPRRAPSSSGCRPRVLLVLALSCGGRGNRMDRGE